MVRDRALFEHIRDAIATIGKFTAGFDREQFLLLENKLVQDGVIRELEIIGEAVNSISEDIEKRFSLIPWRDVAGMRNKLIHEYFDVNLKVVWNTVERDLPFLKSVVDSVLKEFNH